MIERLEALLEQPQIYQSILTKATRLASKLSEDCPYTTQDLAHIGWLGAKQRLERIELEHEDNLQAVVVTEATFAMRQELKNYKRSCDFVVCDSVQAGDYNVGDPQDSLQEGYSWMTGTSDSQQSYDMTGFENQLDTITLLEMLPDDRAREIMQMHLDGHTQEEIADEVYLSQNRVSELITSYYAFYRNNLPEEELELLRIEGQAVPRPKDVNVVNEWNEGFYSKWRAKKAAGLLEKLPAITRVSSGIEYWVGTNKDSQFI